MVDPAVPVVSDTPPEDTLDSLRERLAESEKSGAESKRLYDEGVTTNEQLKQLNSEYQVTLGRYAEQPQTPAQPVAQPAQPAQPEQTYDQEAVTFVDNRSRSVAREEIKQELAKLTVQAQSQQQIPTEPEAREEFMKVAREEYAKVSANPAFSKLEETYKENLAVSQAKARITEAKLTALSSANGDTAVTEANRQLADGASLPGTSGSPGETPVVMDEEAYIKDWMSTPSRQDFMRRFYGNFTPGTDAYNKKFADVARKAFHGVNIGGKTGAAMEFLSGGARAVAR